MTGQADLFGDLGAQLIHPEPIGPATRPLSYGRRLTQRRAELLARGRHPVTGRQLLHPDWQRTCKQCTHRFANGGYWKCDLNYTHGPATDTRLSWPACRSFTERTDP